MFTEAKANISVPACKILVHITLTSSEGLHFPTQENREGSYVQSMKGMI